MRRAKGREAPLLHGGRGSAAGRSSYLAAQLLASPYPVLTCPGNHDRRDAYRKGLLRGPGGGPAPVNTRHDLPGATFLLCDSTLPGHDHGRLDESTMAWLAGQLTTAYRVVVEA